MLFKDYLEENVLGQEVQDISIIVKCYDALTLSLLLDNEKEVDILLEII